MRSPLSCLCSHCSYLRPEPEPLRVELLEVAEPVEVPLLRVLLDPLLTRLLLLELELLVVAEPVEVPLGRELLLEPFTRLLGLLLPVRPVAEPVEAPLPTLLLLDPVLPVRLLLPLAEPVEVPLGRLVEPELLPTRLLLDPLPLTEPVEEPLWLLPELMLPPLALGRTVALGADSLLLGVAGGLLFPSGCVAG